MKQSTSSAFIWSTEDLEDYAETLRESDSITDSQLKEFLDLSEDDKHDILEGIIENVEDRLMEIIGNFIFNGLSEYINDKSK